MFAMKIFDSVVHISTKNFDKFGRGTIVYCNPTYVLHTYIGHNSGNVGCVKCFTKVYQEEKEQTNETRENLLQTTKPCRRTDDMKNSDIFLLKILLIGHYSCVIELSMSSIAIRN